MPIVPGTKKKSPGLGLNEAEVGAQLLGGGQPLFLDRQGGPGVSLEAGVSFVDEGIRVGR